MRRRVGPEACPRCGSSRHLEGDCLRNDLAIEDGEIAVGDEREGLREAGHQATASEDTRTMARLIRENWDRLIDADARVGQLTKERDDFKRAMMAEADRALKEDDRAEVAERRITELEDALQPFNPTYMWGKGITDHDRQEIEVSVGDLRRVRAVLSTSKEETA